MRLELELIAKDGAAGPGCGVTYAFLYRGLLLDLLGVAHGGIVGGGGGA